MIYEHIGNKLSKERVLKTTYIYLVGCEING